MRWDVRRDICDELDKDAFIDPWNADLYRITTVVCLVGSPYGDGKFFHLASLGV